MTEPLIQELLSLLRNTDGSVHVEELAEQVVNQNATILESAEYEDEYERVLLTLHHNQLPKLADAGLVEYDRDENIVTYRGTPSVDAEWLESEQVDDLLAHFQTEREADTDAIGVLEGRQTIIEHGRWLADEADDELFAMYISADLLEEECVRRAENAIERGVEIYVGSQNPDVRELTRKHLPEATLWEPQQDWLDTPSSYPTVGRLVFANREKIMLAVLDEPASEEPADETALIGEGEDNPLVVLVRELLGPRLDHLDYQSSDFHSKLESEL